MSKDHQYDKVSDTRQSFCVDERPDRRTERRYPTDAHAEVTVFVPSGKHLTEGRMVDVSKSGLRLCVPEPVAVGSKLRVRFGDVLAFGEVRWCRQVGNECFDAGVEIDHTMERTLVANLKQRAAAAGGGREDADADIGQTPDDG